MINIFSNQTTSCIIHYCRKRLLIKKQTKLLFYTKWIIKKILKRKAKVDINFFDWETGLYAQGLLDIDVSDYSANSFYEWIYRLHQIKVDCFWLPDQLIHAGNICRLACKDTRWNSLIDQAALFIDKNLVTFEGDKLLLYRQDRLYLDQIGIMADFCVSYSELTNDRRYFDLLLKQILFTMNKQISDGEIFPSHAFLITENKPLGSNSWGRGIGWWLFALVTAIGSAFIDPEHYNLLSSYLVDCLIKVIESQDLNGYLYDDLNLKNHIDTSTTAMCGFCFAQLCLYHKNVLSLSDYDLFKSSAMKCLEAIAKETTKEEGIRNCSGACVMVGVYSNTYDSHYAEGPSLRLINAINELEDRAY